MNLFGKDIKKKLEESMKGTHFTFDGVNMLYYDLNKAQVSCVQKVVIYKL